MNNITQDVYFKQSVVEYSYKYGVTKAAIRYKQHRKTIYRWRERYDGTKESLKNKSRKPHHHPNEHTAKEIEKIKKYKAQNKDTGLVVLWVKLVRAGYTRTISGLFKAMQRIGIYEKAPSKKKQYIPKPYEPMTFPGERVQIDGAKKYVIWRGDGTYLPDGNINGTAAWDWWPYTMVYYQVWAIGENGKEGDKIGINVP